MKQRVHIFGASGSGTTTLGSALCRVIPHEHLDSDNYLWEQKFSQLRPAEKRLALIKEDLEQRQPWILTGAVCGWGDSLKPYFDLVVFLYIPPEIRMERLLKREVERYGDAILPGGSLHEEHVKFMEWASLYDTAGPEVRSRRLHEAWMADLKCPVLRLEEDLTVQERVNRILPWLSPCTSC
ncbi:hypothetical protein DCC85_05015 [Paenibacillus sp. CAA11]|uniref:ATP-binding protein n=1 Tax=Paenibacillus sp. CAA11 TaxID=1532905 RepID=UPI000D358A92|nr:AAA family ATPase [Paenibacillus sp. CAA11]AWB43645.1 hypothetical protein DCC85_05015 [Paenibacillus sp. CAA11]